MGVLPLSCKNSSFLLESRLGSYRTIHPPIRAVNPQPKLLPIRWLHIWITQRDLKNKETNNFPGWGQMAWGGWGLWIHTTLTESSCRFPWCKYTSHGPFKWPSWLTNRLGNSFIQFSGINWEIFAAFLAFQEFPIYIMITEKSTNQILMLFLAK